MIWEILAIGLSTTKDGVSVTFVKFIVDKTVLCIGLVAATR